MTAKQLIESKKLSPEGIESIEDQMNCEMTLLGEVQDGLQKSEVWQSENFWGIGVWQAGSAVLSAEQVDECITEIAANE